MCFLLATCPCQSVKEESCGNAPTLWRTTQRLSFTGNVQISDKAIHLCSTACHIVSLPILKPRSNLNLVILQTWWDRIGCVIPRPGGLWLLGEFTQPSLGFFLMYVWSVVTFIIFRHFRFHKDNLLKVVDVVKEDLEFKNKRGCPFSPLQQGGN